MLVLVSSHLKVVGQRTVPFVGVSLDAKAKVADNTLARYLQKKTQLTFQTESLEYGEAVRTLAEWPSENQPYVARVTPYVYVAAEMLGANLKVLGTYHSAATKGGTIYHSYFVVNRANFPTLAAPGIDDLLRYLKALPTLPKVGHPAHFIYHDKFSTSSYFLPSLFFHNERIFATNEVIPGLTPPVSLL